MGMPDRDAVIKGIQECDLNGGLIGNCPYKNILSMLKEQDAKTGNWIQSNPKFVSAKATGGSRMSTCSNCGKWGRKSFSFCPHCGAKMEGR